MTKKLFIIMLIKKCKLGTVNISNFALTDMGYNTYFCVCKILLA